MINYVFLSNHPGSGKPLPQEKKKIICITDVSYIPARSNIGLFGINTKRMNLVHCKNEPETHVLE